MRKREGDVYRQSFERSNFSYCQEEIVVTDMHHSLTMILPRHRQRGNQTNLSSYGNNIHIKHLSTKELTILNDFT